MLFQQLLHRTDDVYVLWESGLRVLLYTFRLTPYVHARADIWFIVGGSEQNGSKVTPFGPYWLLLTPMGPYFPPRSSGPYCHLSSSIDPSLDKRFFIMRELVHVLGA